MFERPTATLAIIATRARSDVRISGTDEASRSEKAAHPGRVIGDLRRSPLGSRSASRRAYGERAREKNHWPHMGMEIGEIRNKRRVLIFQRRQGDRYS